MKSEKFFRKSDWIAFLVCFFVALTLYVLTLQPTVGLEDSGELVVASDYLGVPHPPGYPIWSLMTWFFQWVFHAVTFHGHPNPAWAVNLFSAVAGAAACGVIALLISRSGMDLLRSMKKESEMLGEKTESLFCAVAGITGGLLLAFAQGMWSQSIIAEVYSFNILFQSLVLLFLYRWMVEPDQPKWLFLCAFAFGLGITNHQTLMFMGLAMAVGILFRDWRLGRDFIITCIPLAIMVVATKVLTDQESTWSWRAGWDHIGFWVWTAYAILIPLIATFTLPKGKIVGPTFLVMLIGLSFYLYMPFSSDQNPPINWGYPRTWQGFMHAITRGQYERVHLSNVLGDPGHFVLQVKSFFGDLRLQFYIPLVLLGFLPFTAWKLKISGKQFSGFLAATALLIPAAGLIVVQKLLGLKYPNGNYEIFTQVTNPLIFALFLLFGIGFALSIINLIDRSFSNFKEFITNPSLWDKATAVLMLLLATGIVGISFLLNIQLIKALMETAGSNPTWVNYSVAAWIILPPLLLAVAFILKRKTSTALSFDINEEGQHWFVTTVVAFIAVGLVFVILQNPKTDIQSLFIGRVQYIQSHAIYALWLGYGLLLLSAYIEVLFKNNRTIRYLLVASTLALPAVLIAKNKYDPVQRKIYGGSEQTGHDFGWQFGNWQLQGVDGIKEDMQAWYAQEEFEKQWALYPNKNYPEPMGPNAIFFGGTDPGRFVPTYMIYSAKVRQDVYLITQNALADNTYMAVMRDLYGDQIWIPSPTDNNMAFQKFLQTNQRATGVSTTGGKVQVQGVQHVMKINGFLSQWIFDHNQYLTETKTDEATRPTGAVQVDADPVIDPKTGKPPLRSFYVEESYVLPWMYPYLTPNGLIMKINNQPTPLTPEIIKNDTDFWAWNCERLLSDEKFIRDIVARKTFSKLRSALAGLYVARGNAKEAEAAFRQAVALYDLSPEANFHLADLISRRGRFDEAIALFDVFLEKDPNNGKAKAFQDRLKQIKDVTGMQQRLEQQLRTGNIEFVDAMQLISIYLQTKKATHADNLAKQMLSSSTLTPEMLMQLAQQMARGNRKPVVEQVLKKYTTVRPKDPNGWINLAALQLVLKKQGEMWVSIDKAIATGGESARTTIKKDTRFNAIRNTKEYQKRFPQLNTGLGSRPGQGIPSF